MRRETASARRTRSRSPLTHRPPPRDGGVRHRSAFGCPATFGAHFVSMAFDASALDFQLVVSVNICAREGERVTFGQFMRYGVPITLVQLSVGAPYVVLLAVVLRGGADTRECD